MSLIANVPLVEPLRFEAGSTLLFQKSFPDYSGTTWSLNYYLRSPALAAINIAATANGSDFLVNIPAATTASWAAGTYLMSGEVSLSPDRFTIYQNEIVIQPNAQAASTLDYQTWAQKTLAIVEAVISGAMARRDVSYSINGRSISSMTHIKLLESRAWLRAEIAQEKSFGKNRKILTRYVNPTFS